MTGRPEHTPRLTAGDLASNPGWLDIAPRFRVAGDRREFSDIYRVGGHLCCGGDCPNLHGHSVVVRYVAPNTPVTLVPRHRT